MSIEPLTTLPIPSQIAKLPKADIHIHHERLPRLDRVLAKLEGRAPYDWHQWAQDVMKLPAGDTRLGQIGAFEPVPLELDDISENCIARIEDLLEEAAIDGAVLVETRMGNVALRADFLDLFHEAVRRAQAKYPALQAAAIVTLLLWRDPEILEREVQACIDLAKEGLMGVDLLYSPYVQEADWDKIYPIAERLARAGLGITAHAGEFSTANMAAALKTPGITRIGHGTYAATDPQLMEQIKKSGITLECSLSCNVVLGAVETYEAHPIQQFVAYGIPVALCTDDPVRVWTTIGREYAIAYALGFSESELLNMTCNAVKAAFISPAVKDQLLNSICD